MYNDRASKVIAVVNQKGGVGKTTTVVNLATAFAAIDKSVLVIDFDPQGNASTSFGLSRNDRKLNIYHILDGEVDVNDAISRTALANLDIAAADNYLSIMDYKLCNEVDQYNVLQRVLGNIKKHYDFIFIDCPPSIGTLTINAMTAATSIIIPVQCEFLSLEGLTNFMKTYKMVKNNLNIDLTIEGVLLTMYDKRYNLTSQVENDVRHFFGKDVYDTVIPRNVRVSEAPSHGKPLLIYDLHCQGSVAYLNLAKEMMCRNGIIAS